MNNPCVTCKHETCIKNCQLRMAYVIGLKMDKEKDKNE